MMHDQNAYQQSVQEHCEIHAKPQDAGASSEVECSNQEPKEGDSRKRERESFSYSGMLNWLCQYATMWNDPSARNDDFMAQALIARQALFTGNSKNSSGEQLQQDKRKKLKEHPTLYEDHVLNSRWTETLRCRNKTTYLTKCCDSSCCVPHATKKDLCTKDGSKEQKEFTKESEDIIDQHKQAQSCIPPHDLDGHKSTKIPVQKPVLVGAAYQAEVSKWTGIISGSDPKWLGTRMWPPEHGETKSTVGSRQDLCNCVFPNSVECVRFHIAEKRFHLKRELGALFYQWLFDRMGEEISLSWTKDAEKKFKALIEYAKFPKSFWKNAKLLLPNMKREDLVSYYFNVYQIQRRSYQNRVTPHDVDSDNDDKECGMIGDSFGYKALHSPGVKSLLPCTLNMESRDFV